MTTPFNPEDFGAVPVQQSNFDPASFGAVPVQDIKQDVQQPVVQETPSLTSETVNNFTGELHGASSQIKQGIGQIATATHPLTNTGSFLSNVGEALGGAKNAAEGALGAGAGAVNAIYAPITAPLTTIAHHVYNADKENGGPISTLVNLPEVQQSRKVLSDWAQAHPELAKTISDALTVATGLVGGESSIAKAGVGDVLNASKDVGSKVVDRIATQQEEQAAKQVTKKLQDIAQDWARPTVENTAGYKTATKIVEKNKDIPQFLAEQGLNPSTHVVDGRYLTNESAQSLRETAGKMSADTLRPSLQMADYITPKTPVKDLEAKAIETAQSTPNITASNMETIIGKIKQESASLQKKYPEGMSLTDMHDNKITYAKNGGYSPVNDPKVNNTATANRSFSSALGKTVEIKAPPEVPVGDFNKYLSKYYKAADYLDAIHTKKAPVTLAQQIARGVAKFGGAALGGHFGGGIVSEFAGYQIGKAIEHAMENLSNPARESFLKNLKITNPEAYTKVEQYLGKAQAEQETRLQLPSPRFTPLPAETKTKPQGSIQVLDAKKGPVGVNKKTGKFQSTFTSEGTPTKTKIKTPNPLERDLSKKSKK